MAGTTLVVLCSNGSSGERYVLETYEAETPLGGPRQAEFLYDRSNPTVWCWGGFSSQAYDVLCSWLSSQASRFGDMQLLCVHFRVRRKNLWTRASVVSVCKSDIYLAAGLIGALGEASSLTYPTPHRLEHAYTLIEIRMF